MTRFCLVALLVLVACGTPTAPPPPPEDLNIRCVLRRDDQGRLYDACEPVQPGKKQTP